MGHVSESTSGILLGIPPSSGRAPHLPLPHQTKSKVGEGGKVATGTNLVALSIINSIEDANSKFKFFDVSVLKFCFVGQSLSFTRTAV